MVEDPVGSASTGVVVTKQVSKVNTRIPSIVVFMKALLLLVENRRWTHSLAIALIQSVFDGSGWAAPRSHDPDSAGPLNELLSHPSSCLLAIRCFICHLWIPSRGSDFVVGMRCSPNGDILWTCDGLFQGTPTFRTM